MQGRLNLLFSLMILCGVLVAAPVLAAETPQTGQQGTVLGQTANSAPTNDGKADAGQPAGTAGNSANGKPDAQALFEESLRQMMPLDDGQIQESQPFGST
jgi:hypothetical protein